MAIQIVNASNYQNKIVPVRGKYGYFTLEFTSDDHIIQIGVKAKFRLNFSSEVSRNSYFDLLQSDYSIFLNYVITKVNSDNVASEVEIVVQTTQTDDNSLNSRGLTSYQIIIEAKEEGTDWNNLTLPNGSFTSTQLVTGIDTAYKRNYQLVIIALNEKQDILFTALYPYVLKNGIASWNINLAENFAPLVFSEVPDLSISSLTKVNTPTTNIEIKYGEACEDDTVNDGKLQFYSMASEDFSIGNFKLKRSEELDEKYFRDIDFYFLTNWDRDKPYLLTCDSIYFLYFYLKNDAPILKIKTVVDFKDGTSQSFEIIENNVEKGIYTFPAGTNNHPNLTNLSNIKSYSMQIAIGDTDPPSAYSEVFEIETQDNNCAYEILFLNSLGAFDRIGFDDLPNENINLLPIEYLSNPSGNGTQNGGIAISNIDTKSEFIGIYQNGFQTETLQNWIKDFLASEEKYLVKGSQLYRIKGSKQEHTIQNLDNKVILEFPFTTNHPL